MALAPASHAKVEVRFTTLRAGAIVPRYMTAGAAGLDLCALLSPEDAHRSGDRLERVIRPGERMLIGTGLAIAIPAGYEGQVRPRSGLALRHGITVVNSPGTIDSDYRGEIGIVLINHGQEPFVLASGERIAQLVVAPVIQATLVEGELDATGRGAGGYGSTGTRGPGETPTGG